MTSQPLTEQQLADIRARADAATPGPWGTHRDLDARYTVQARPRTTRNGMESDGDIATLPADRTDAENYANATFVARAREDVPALLAELAAVRAERDAFREQRNNVFATNERLLAKVDESGQERLRAENEIRTVKREARDELAAFRALELGDLDNRVSATCAEPDHPTWLREKDDTRGCPWCRVNELETYAHGCDGEGCVLPHSSWCEVAQKTAAANDGCTCPQPWKGHPQPHAGYCWLVSPPRNEIEEMRRALAAQRTEAAR